MINGNTAGLSQAVIKKLERLEGRRSQSRNIISIELARMMCTISAETGRQVAVLLTRQGDVEEVIAGTPDEIVIPVLSRFKLVPGRLRQLRLVRTDPMGKMLDDDDFTDLALLRLDSISAISYMKEGELSRIETAHLMPPDSEELFAHLDDRDIFNQRIDFPDFIEALDAEITAKTEASHTVKQGSYAVLTGCFRSKDDAQVNLDELEELARSADVGVAARMPQTRQLHPRYVIGPGRLKEIVIRALASGAEYLIFDNELSPSQARAITEYTELKVIDRTQLILDIFANRAKTNEGKLRVEIAQLKYMLPRLSLKDDSLSRLSGGIGGRGPGETRLEVDKRRISDRIVFLMGKLKTQERARDTQRLKRKRNDIPVVSIIGYTNAGKSTLLNNLTKSDVYADNLLFATLDTSSKRIRFPRERDVIITDTVGFIRDLPANLTGAFKSTLEELGDADLFLHVVDASDKHYEKHIKSVETILEEMELDKTERLMVFNKCDRLTEDELYERENKYRKAVFVSALDRKTFVTMLDRLHYFFYKEGVGGDDITVIEGFN